MKEETKKKSGQAEKPATDEEFPLPHCTTAPDAEHSRAENEDEPCDDSRAAETPEDDEPS